MKPLQDHLQQSIQDGARAGLVESIRSQPSTTLGDLMELSRGSWGNMIRSVTVGELVGGTDRVAAAKGRVSTIVVARPQAAVGATKRTRSAVNTRTPAGRAEYDQAIIDALSGASSPLSANDVRAKVGGTSLQARTALNRLIEAGKVRWSGRARGTKYTV